MSFWSHTHRCIIIVVCVCPEHEMEQKLQDHRQEIQKLTQDWELEKEKIVYQTALKLEAEEVSGNCQIFYGSKRLHGST